MSGTPQIPTLHEASVSSRTPGLTVEPSDLASLSADCWDRLLVPGRRLLCRAFLEAASTVELEGFVLGALVARRNGTIVAATPAYPYCLDLATFAGGPARRIASALRHLVPSLLKMRVFEVGWPSTLIEPLVGEKDPAVLRAMAEAALSQADRQRADLTVLRDFAATDEAAAATFGPLGFEAVPLATEYALSLAGFESYDGYVAALRSDYRKELKRLSRSRQVTFEHVRDFSPLTREITTLWRSAYERARDLHRESFGEVFFARLARIPDASALLVRDADGTLTRCGVLHDDRPTLRFLFYGGPPTVEHDLSYPKMLNQVVRLGIEDGFQTIELGATTGGPKLALGATPRPLRAWLRHRSAVVQRGLVALMRGPLAPREPGPRHVFRADRNQGGSRAQRPSGVGGRAVPHLGRDATGEAGHPDPAGDRQR